MIKSGPESDAQRAGRPGRPKDQEKRELILDAAGCLFMEKGYEATSIDEIARDAGVSKQTVYSHFRNKDDLFRACIHAKVSEYGLQLAAVPTGCSPGKTLEYLGERMLSLLSDPSVLSMFRVMISEAGARPKVVRAFFDAGPEATNRNVAGYLQSLLGLDSERAMEATHTFFSLLKSSYFIEMLMELRQPLEAAQVRRHVRRAVEQFLAIYPETR